MTMSGSTCLDGARRMVEVVQKEWGTDEFSSSPGHQDAPTQVSSKIQEDISIQEKKKRHEAFEERKRIWMTTGSKEQKQKAILKNHFKQKNNFAC